MNEPTYDNGGGPPAATVTDNNVPEPAPPASAAPAPAPSVVATPSIGSPRHRRLGAGDRFVARTGFDPRALATPYRWFRISPRRLQACREVNEMPDHERMRDSRWLV
ncbi:hypothetical protein ABZ793_26570 [Micromonospora sp. NPDC047465]|uniref:hypothetical protein n=1 Tax=Micromonospora sp. NPDC047465 TaxID=3154813 RepID=UPI0034100D66